MSRGLRTTGLVSRSLIRSFINDPTPSFAYKYTSFLLSKCPPGQFPGVGGFLASPSALGWVNSLKTSKSRHFDLRVDISPTPSEALSEQVV